MEKLYEIVKKLRIKNRYSQKEVSEKLNLSQAAYAKIENGGTELTIKRLREIADIYEMDLIEILEMEPKIRNEPSADIVEELNDLKERFKIQDRTIAQYQEIVEEKNQLLESLREVLFYCHLMVFEYKFDLDIIIKIMDQLEILDPDNTVKINNLFYDMLSNSDFELNTYKSNKERLEALKGKSDLKIYLREKKEGTKIVSDYIKQSYDRIPHKETELKFSSPKIDTNQLRNDLFQSVKDYFRPFIRKNK